LLRQRIFFAFKKAKKKNQLTLTGL